MRSNNPRLFFSKDELIQIGDAIAAAELNTTGEIRIRLERRCETNPLERARLLMNKLGLTATKNRTGVLIYIAVEDHRFAIFGDEGLHQILGTEGWSNLSDELSNYFKQGEFCGGIINVVKKIGEILAQSFPAAPENMNELTDELSFEE